MKTTILLVSFGTSYQAARENSLNKIFEDVKSAVETGAQGVQGGETAFFQAYTSDIIIKKLAKEGVLIDTVEEALHKISAAGADRLYVVPTHMLAGIEYRKLLQELEPFREKFQAVTVTPAVLQHEEDCEELIPVLRQILRFREDREYILMGHGTEAEANERYGQMNEALAREGLHNVRIASVEARPDILDAIEELRKRGTGKPVVLHPFMVVAGDHAHNDMAGEVDSFAAALRHEGYQVETVVKGLGEYAAFRSLYVERLREAMEH